MGEAAGGPASNARNPNDEDEHGHTNYLEHFADWDNFEREGHNDSEETLTEEGDDEDDFPNWWFAVRRKIREPLAE